MDLWRSDGRFQPRSPRSRLFCLRRRESIQLIILMLLVSLTVQPIYAQANAMPLAAYWDTITEIRNDLAAAQVDETAVRASAAAQLAAITEIELPDGRFQAIDHGYLIQQLEGDSSTESITTQLTAYLSSRHGWPEPTFPTLDEAALAAILSQPEFQYAPDEPNFFQRLWQDVRQRIEDFFLQLFPEGSALQIPLSNLMVGLAAVLIVVALAFGLRGVLANLTGDAVLAAESELGGEPLTADLALQRAQELSTAGDYRTAVRYLYLSSLLLLEERGLLRYDRSLTNREYLRTVAHRPELATTLRDVIDVFDRVWYGFQTLTATEYAAYAQRVEALKQQKEAR